MHDYYLLIYLYMIIFIHYYLFIYLCIIIFIFDYIDNDISSNEESKQFEFTEEMVNKANEITSNPLFVISEDRINSVCDHLYDQVLDLQLSDQQVEWIARITTVLESANCITKLINNTNLFYPLKQLQAAPFNIDRGRPRTKKISSTPPPNDWLTVNHCVLITVPHETRLLIHTLAQENDDQDSDIDMSDVEDEDYSSPTTKSKRKTKIHNKSPKNKAVKVSNCDKDAASHKFTLTGQEIYNRYYKKMNVNYTKPFTTLDKDHVCELFRGAQSATASKSTKIAGFNVCLFMY